MPGSPASHIRGCASVVADEFIWPPRARMTPPFLRVIYGDGGITPFKGQKSEAWERGYRAPMVIRWPGVIRPGTVKNQLFAALD